MCQRVVCPTCKKYTFAGCGQHVEQVLAGVPESNRCSCGQNSGSSEGKQRRFFGRG
jgi:hypothetical protein